MPNIDKVFCQSWSVNTNTETVTTNTHRKNIQKSNQSRPPLSKKNTLPSSNIHWSAVAKLSAPPVMKQPLDMSVQDFFNRVAYQCARQNFVDHQNSKLLKKQNFYRRIYDHAHLDPIARTPDMPANADPNATTIINAEGVLTEIFLAFDKNDIIEKEAR